jgi:predicted Zn-dependent protease with MMP-like domain
MVRETVWHEIAHYFGMDEPQVRDAERKRARVLAKRIERLR